MKKSIAFCLGLLAVMGGASAQSEITSITYNKQEQPALMLDLSYKEDLCQDFIVSSLKKTGYNPETKGKFFWKQNKLDGFYIFKEVHLEGLKGTLNLYFKVDEKRKAKDGSVIYLLVSKEEGTFVSSGTDEQAFNAAKKFLNSFVGLAAAYKLDLDVKEQEDVVKDEEKRLARLRDDEKDLTKKIDQLEKDLKRNRSDQDDQTKTVDKEKRKLADLKAQVADLK
ncbi:MAG TPA: hypothetical protein VNR87_11545 [Flavisolibacter sp.]|nr:hypothetical protein [Flavisolibacter sp.]